MGDDVTVTPREPAAAPDDAHDGAPDEPPPPPLPVDEASGEPIPQLASIVNLPVGSDPMCARPPSPA